MSNPESREDRAEADKALKDFFSGQCTVINSDLAQRPEFVRNIKKRLREVGNHCFGDVGAELRRNPALGPAATKLSDALFSQLIKN